MKGITVAIALLALPLFGGDQSMGEAARKARELRAKNAKEGVKAKSYTQDDVKKAPPLANDPKAPPAHSGPPPSPAPPGSAGGIPASATPTAGGQSEASWRQRVAEARRRIEDARKEHEYWSGYTMVPGEILVDEKDRPVITTIEQLQGKTAEAKRAVEAAEKALANLEEEARRSGVPPGWLR
jgi:hypothetical protein